MKISVINFHKWIGTASPVRPAELIHTELKKFIDWVKGNRVIPYMLSPNVVFVFEVFAIRNVLQLSIANVLNGDGKRSAVT